jgi:uncharacterized membrane protein YgdD (TMEM256/DUF423 family)
MERKWLLTGVAFMAIGIALGAFGAHGLKQVISDSDKLLSFETGVRYQLIHGVAFLALGALADRFSAINSTVFRLLTSGVFLFSFSIYALVFASIGGDTVLSKILGPITPIGGLLLIAGWILLFARLWKNRI